uniref:Transmembrane protein n=1 Tax=Globodera pallida TaxID=36090 RepID=A0A183CKD1_GLOPA
MLMVGFVLVHVLKVVLKLLLLLVGLVLVPIGFGWTNGAVLDLLATYGHELTLQEMPAVKCNKNVKEPEPEVFPPVKAA